MTAGWFPGVIIPCQPLHHEGVGKGERRLYTGIIEGLVSHLASKIFVFVISQFITAFTHKKTNISTPRSSDWPRSLHSSRRNPNRTGVPLPEIVGCACLLTFLTIHIHMPIKMLIPRPLMIILCGFSAKMMDTEKNLVPITIPSYHTSESIPPGSGGSRRPWMIQPPRW